MYILITHIYVNQTKQNKTQKSVAMYILTQNLFPKTGEHYMASTKYFEEWEANGRELADEPAFARKTVGSMTVRSSSKTKISSSSSNLGSNNMTSPTTGSLSKSGSSRSLKGQQNEV